MAKKKRRRRPSGGPARQRPQTARSATDTAPQKAAPQRGRGVSEASAVRRDRKEEARHAREAALRRLRRQRTFRRVGVWAVASVAIILVFTLLTRFHHHKYNHVLAARADRIAAQAGCTPITSPPDKGRDHVSGPITYDQQPPTSGPHNPSPLNAGVYNTPQQENNMVHSLEHGAIEIYYMTSGPTALSQGVIGSLQTIAQGKKVIMTPAPQPLAGGQVGGRPVATSVAFAAWDRLRQCPATITVDQANVIARSFIDQFTDADSAPEAGRAI